MVNWSKPMIPKLNEIKEAEDQKKAEQNEINEKLKERDQALYARTNEYKQLWVKNGIIQFKNERIAILKRQVGAQVEFIIAFDDLTKEGYQLKAIDEGKGAEIAGMTGGAVSYYYFQKIA